MSQDDNDTVLHQAAHEEIIDDAIEAGVGLDMTNLTAASVAHALNATFSDTEVEAALNALGAKINELQTVVEARFGVAS